MIKGIIFDCFGVLAGLGYKAIYKQAGGNLDKDSDFIDDVLAKANSGLTSSKHMHQQVADRIGMSYEVWHETVQAGEALNLELLDYIKALKPKYKVAILSNANVGTLQRKFSQDQLNLFDSVVVSAEVRMLKPNAEIYQLTAERLGLKPNECIFIDDSPLYCDGARATGMEAIWYQSLDQLKRDLNKLLSTGVDKTKA